MHWSDRHSKWRSDLVFNVILYVFCLGIPVKKWVGCLFDKQKVKTTKVIIHYSDSSVWTPAHTVADKTVPVQVEISSKIGDKIITEINSILRYREKNPKEESIFVSFNCFYSFSVLINMCIFRILISNRLSKVYFVRADLINYRWSNSQDNLEQRSRFHIQRWTRLEWAAMFLTSE